jgi:hypothetical protein
MKQTQQMKDYPISQAASYTARGKTPLITAVEEEVTLMAVLVVVVEVYQPEVVILLQAAAGASRLREAVAELRSKSSRNSIHDIKLCCFFNLT